MYAMFFPWQDNLFSHLYIPGAVDECDSLKTFYPAMTGEQGDGQGPVGITGAGTGWWWGTCVVAAAEGLRASALC